MNNFYFILIIWFMVYFLIGWANNTDENYDYMSPEWLKLLGNPLTVKKEVQLSIALVRVFNNVLFIVSVVGYFFENDRDIYWKLSGAKYILIIIILFLFSIILEQIFVIYRKKQKRDNKIGGNVGAICLFFSFSLFMMYLYYRFLLLPFL